ncbi:hypothetical protein DCS_01929 [Drechmeria coniospora]|uniref:RING-type E3 ubiquitin transferase n=1 Tax=Drechmeria coniospora TaxID=98403 RepID=A0A151GUP3_DRECN|nr:hypothetical protein DCS_01929 [Drechmeria coniospora]KYK60791.1 hypothetical protein DCS_01929 [Drechmeria coniospora]ODA83485.1 hypothetical protein RJ55_01999 [Drechmeria coniospora]
MPTPRRARWKLQENTSPQRNRGDSSLHNQPSHAPDDGVYPEPVPIGSNPIASSSPWAKSSVGTSDESATSMSSVGDAQGTSHERGDDICVVCLDPITEFCQLHPCRHHNYHFGCIDEWLSIGPGCPICTSRVSRIVHGPIGQQRTTEYRSSPTSTVVPRAAAAFRGRAPQPQTVLSWSLEPEGLPFRRHVYRHLRYSKHVGANRTSGYREVTRDMFCDLRLGRPLLDRARIFLRRELRVFAWLTTPETDSLVPFAGEDGGFFRRRRMRITVERMLGHIVVLLQRLEIRGSDGSLEDDLTSHLGRENARLLLHELLSFLRSPYVTLAEWDRNVQYGDAREPEAGVPEMMRQECQPTQQAAGDENDDGTSRAGSRGERSRKRANVWRHVPHGSWARAPADCGERPKKQAATGHVRCGKRSKPDGGLLEGWPK